MTHISVTQKQSESPTAKEYVLAAGITLSNQRNRWPIVDDSF